MKRASLPMNRLSYTPQNYYSTKLFDPTFLINEEMFARGAKISNLSVVILGDWNKNVLAGKINQQARDIY